MFTYHLIPAKEGIKVRKQPLSSSRLPVKGELISVDGEMFHVVQVITRLITI